MEVNKAKKSKISDENECPSTSKRLKKTHTTWKLVTEDEGPEVLEQMGIGMLESDESSSSASAVEALPKISPENIDENSNANDFPETQSTNAIVLESSGSGGIRKLEAITDNANFVDPNETIIPCNYKSINTNIEIYTDNKSVDRVQKKIGSSHSKGRSPLATVSCNNNGNIITQSNSSIDSSGVKKKVFMPDENFFLFSRRSAKVTIGKDYFKKLSDEMILQIFKWLPKKALIRCSYVCQRFNQLAEDESLWTRLDLGCKTLKSGAVGKIVLRGVVILRLAQAEMAHPVIEPESIESYPEFQTKLQYLDLSMAVITKPSLKTLLSKCRLLRKLSLEHVKINDEICEELSKNVNMEVLNLTMCEGLEGWSIKKLLSELKQLTSLNISWTSLNVESINAVVENISPEILRLNLAGCRKAMFDSHIANLVKRCPALLELDLSDCTALTSAVIPIVCKLKELEYLSLSRCYSITATAYMDLISLKSLAFLDVFGLLSDNALNMLQNTFPSVGINRFIHTAVARPTVGTRRTSIWGLRTRD